MNVVSLFSGCGGLDLGLERAGFRVRLALDSDAHCAASYRANFPEAKFVHAPIGELPESDLREGADLLVGGPPCPPFSKSRFYRTSKPRALADAVGHETLHGYLDTLKRLRPRAFLLENVAGMAYAVHREALHLLLETAETLGYTTAWRVLNAAQYGVPQIRERFLLVGMRGKQAFRFPEPTHAKPEGPGLFADELPPWRTTGEVLDDLDTEENANDAGHFAGGKYHHVLRAIPPGENYLHFTAERGHPSPMFRWRSRYWSFLLKLSRDLPSWTIQARRSNNMGPFHWRNRILRIAEIKRLQTFPDDWHLAGTVEKQWRQIGNAVPPRLAEVLGQALREQLGG